MVEEKTNAMEFVPAIQRTILQNATYPFSKYALSYVK